MSRAQWFARLVANRDALILWTVEVQYRRRARDAERQGLLDQAGAFGVRADVASQRLEAMIGAKPQ